MNELTTKFLQQIWNIFPNFSYYRLAENKKWGAHLIDKKELSKYNADNMKFWIYFTPNGEYALSSWVRKKVNAKKMFCFFAEKDTKEKFWESFPLKPSIVNETKRWHHVYWLLEEPMEYSEKWDNIQTALCDLLETDKWAKDAARIMRVPWFKYRKDNEGTFVINTIILNTDRKYKISSFSKILNIKDMLDAQKHTIKKEVWQDAYTLVNAIDSAVDVREVLYDLWGWRWEVRWFSIYEDWRITWGYKYYKSVNGLNNFTEHDDYRPVWWPFSVAKTLLNSTPKAFDYFRENHWLGIKQKTIYEYDWPSVEIDEVQQRKTISIGSWEVIYDTEKNKILWNNWKDEKEVMDAIIEPKWHYEINNIKYFICEYKKQSDSWYMVFHELWRAGKLEATLSQKWITFFWNKYVKQRIVWYIHSAEKKYRYIDSLGLYWKDMVIHKIWQTTVDDSKPPLFIKITDLHPSNRLSDEVLTIPSDKVSHKDIIETIDKLKQMYKWHISVTLFVLFAMTLFSYHIRNELWFFPSWFLVWLTQSWKTSLRRAVMKIFWIDKCMELQATTTHFVLLKMMKHYMPICIWEYNNTDSKVNWDDVIKNNYDGTMNSRWTATQETIDYPTNAAFILDGESRSMNNAVFSRTIMFFMNPWYRQKHIRSFKNINRYFVDNYNNINSLLMNFDEECAMLTDMFKWQDKSDKDRVIENYWLLLWFAKTFNIYDETKEEIIEQCNQQFSMMADDNVEKNTKTLMGLALYHNLNIWFIDVHEPVLKIEFDVDVLKVDWGKIKELQSQIQTTNHHFNIWYQWYDELYIPLNFLFKTTSVHPSFNRFLNRISVKHTIEWKCAGAIKEYAKENWYTKQRFYSEIGIDEWTNKQLWNKEG